MKIYSEYNDGRLTIFLRGELDHHEVKEAAGTIDGQLEKYLPQECVLDLSGLSFMDSSGIALILRLNKRMNESGGRAWVENPVGQPFRVLDTSGIDRMVKIAAIREAKV